ncbi:MAG TPA: MFS transporter, partial [Acidobacteriota bacterium]|nr:MFS transporter [Acidobacteriota bacterium]
YIYVTYTLAMVFYTAINIPYGALMGVMTPHSNERTVLASFRFYGAFGANLLVQSTILILVIRLGGSDDGQTATQLGYVNTMALYALGAALLFLVTFYATKERIRPPKDQEMNLRKDLAQLVANKPWLAIIVVGVTTILWLAMRDTAILYYFRYYVVEAVEEGARFAKLATWFGIVGTISTIAGIGFTRYFTGVFRGKRNAYMCLSVLVALTATLYYFARPGDIAFIFFVQILTSFLAGPLMPLFWSMIADTADYSEWKFGRRFTGLIFSAGTFSQKVGWAIGPGIAGHLLDHYGFVANVAQSAETINGLRLMMSFIPSAIGLGAAALVMLYGINLKMEKKMEAELSARKKAEGTLET